MIIPVVLALVLAAAPGVSAANKRTLAGDLGDHFLPNCVNSCVTQFFAEGAGSKYIEMEITYKDYLVCLGCSGPYSETFRADFIDGKATVAFEADTRDETVNDDMGSTLIQGMTFQLQLPYSCSTEEHEITGVYVCDDEPGTCGDFKQTCSNNGVTTALSVYMDTWCSCPGVDAKKLETRVTGFKSCA